MTIYSNFWLDYHYRKQLGMGNAHLPLKMSLFSTPFWYFKNAKTYRVLVSYCYNIYDKSDWKFQIHISYEIKVMDV